MNVGPFEDDGSFDAGIVDEEGAWDTIEGEEEEMAEAAEDEMYDEELKEYEDQVWAQQQHEQNEREQERQRQEQESRESG
jgi:hypothetical protein